MIIDERIFSKLTDEQKKAVEDAQSPEELLAFAKEIGYELTDEQLSAVSEGSWCEPFCAGYCSSFCREDSFDRDRLRYGSCPDLCLRDQ